MAINIAYQLQLSRLVPQVIKNKDYDSYFQLITRINDILNNSGLDLEFAESYIYQKKKGPEDKLTPKEVKRHTKYAVTGLRCMIVKHLTGLSFRDLSIRIAESQLLQNFCRINNVDKVKAPSKSQLQRYSICFSQDSINNLIKDLFFKASSKDNTLNLCTPFNAEDIYIDATCLEANIHFPVDWLLLRDGMISLLKSILVIRKHGLKHRMKPPEHFINDINNLCIEMSNTRRKPGSKKRRKEIFRQLKALSKVIRSHAKRYYNLLNEQWEKRTDLSEGQVNEVLRRIDDINEKLPQAIEQARNRIITGLKVKSKDKILSLFDNSANVITRGKSSAELEFGNKLFIAEQSDGFIIDWKLYENSAPSDPTITIESLKRIKENSIDIKNIAGDRGCDSKSSKKQIAKDRINNNICPRNPPD